MLFEVMYVVCLHNASMLGLFTDFKELSRRLFAENEICSNKASQNH